MARHFQCLICNSFLPNLRAVEAHIAQAHQRSTKNVIKNGVERTGSIEEMLSIKKVTFTACYVPLVRNQIDPSFLQLYESLQAWNDEVLPTKAKSKSDQIGGTDDRTSSIKISKSEGPAKNQSNKANFLRDFSEKPAPGLLELDNNGISDNSGHSKGRTLSQKAVPKTCKFCAKTFPFKRSHDLHMKMEHLKTYDFRRVCVFCGKPFVHYRDLEIHYRAHTLERPFFCTMCDSEKGTKENLAGHIKTHETNRELHFLCDLCPKKFFTSAGLYQHKQTHLGEKRNRFKCQVCDRGFPLRRNLRVHLETHKQDRARPFGCGICKKRYHTSTTLKKHLNSHDERKAFCEQCEKYFKNEICLKNHVQSQHNADRKRKFRCQLCPMKFFTKNTLDGHIKTHSGIRPYNCDLCDASFQTRRGVKRHKLAVHEGVKPFQCEVCKHKFALNHNLKAHMEIYKGKCLEILLAKPKPNKKGKFQCKICKKEFPKSCNLTLHMETHEKDRKRKFSCDVCKEKFFTVNTLRSHKQTHDGYKCGQCSMVFWSRKRKEKHEAEEHSELVAEGRRKEEGRRGILRAKEGAAKVKKKISPDKKADPLLAVSVKKEPLEESFCAKEDLSSEMMVMEVKYEF